MQVHLAITYDTDTKDVAVKGPTDDIGLCHLLLDLGRQSLFGHTMQCAAERRVVVPNGLAMPNIKPS